MSELTPREAKDYYAKWSESERCRLFVPNGKQEEFIKLVGNGLFDINLFIAANGVGKDTVGINILANIFWGPQSNWFRGLPLFENWPYPKHIRVITESKLVEETGPIDQEIQKWWPRGRYTASKMGKQYISQYKTDTGFLVDKMTYEQELREYEGVTLGGLFGSEPPPEDIYNACVSRFRHGGPIVLYMTPLMSSAFVQDKLLDRPDCRAVFADIEDNCQTHGMRGILTHENIDKMISKMDPDEVEARAHGKFMHLSNVILGKAFERKHHVISDDREMPPGAQQFHIVDPARGKRWAMIWGWVDQRGQMVIDREYPLEDWASLKDTDLMIKDYVDIIKIMDKGPVEFRVIDRHFANSKNDYGTTLKQDLAEKFGLEFSNSYACDEEIETGIQKMKDNLGFNKKMAIDSLNYPRLVVKARCRNTIKSLERAERDPDTLQVNRKSIWKDFFDCVRYLCMAGLEVWVPRPFSQPSSGYVLGR